MVGKTWGPKNWTVVDADPTHGSLMVDAKGAAKIWTPMPQGPSTAGAPLARTDLKPESRLEILLRLLLHWGDLAHALHHRLHVRSSRTFGQSVSAGPAGRRAIALTFDDGPSLETGKLLDYLASEGIRATFFQCGLNVLRYPEMAKRVHAEGHEIGNHTFSHARLCPQLRRKPNWRTAGNIFRELAETQKILKSITGTHPTLFRPPYGLRWFGLGKAQRNLGLLGVRWTVIGHDWEWPAARIADHVLQNIGPGGILCLHDGRDIQTKVDLSPLLAALQLIIPVLKAQDYSFHTVSELLTLAP